MIQLLKKTKGIFNKLKNIKKPELRNLKNFCIKITGSVFASVCIRYAALKDIPCLTDLPQSSCVHSDLEPKTFNLNSELPQCSKSCNSNIVKTGSGCMIHVSYKQNKDLKAPRINSRILNTTIGNQGLQGTEILSNQNNHVRKKAYSKVQSERLKQKKMSSNKNKQQSSILTNGKNNYGGQREFNFHDPHKGIRRMVEGPSSPPSAHNMPVPGKSRVSVRRIENQEPQTVQDIKSMTRSRSSNPVVDSKSQNVETGQDGKLATGAQTLRPVSETNSKERSTNVDIHRGGGSFSGQAGIRTGDGTEFLTNNPPPGTTLTQTNIVAHVGKYESSVLGPKMQDVTVSMNRNNIDVGKPTPPPGPVSGPIKASFDAILTGTITKLDSKTINTAAGCLGHTSDNCFASNVTGVALEGCTRAMGGDLSYFPGCALSLTGPTSTISNLGNLGQSKPSLASLNTGASVTANLGLHISAEKIIATCPDPVPPV